MNNSTLSQRDKKLLYALIIIVVIFVFVWCLIRPLYKGIAKNGELLEVASTLESSNRSRVDSLSGAQSTAAKFEQDLSSYTAGYYDNMDSSEIDKLVTTYILKNGLTSRSLTIYMPDEYVNEDPYIYSALYPSDVVTDEDTDSDSDEPIVIEEEKEKKRSGYFFDAVSSFLTGKRIEKMALLSSPIEEYSGSMSEVSSTESSGIYCVKLEILMEGKEEALQGVIDDLSKNPAVRISGFYWIKLDPITYLQEDGTVLVYENANKQLMMRVNLYMKDKA